MPGIKPDKKYLMNPKVQLGIKQVLLYIQQTFKTFTEDNKVLRVRISSGKLKKQLMAVCHELHKHLAASDRKREVTVMKLASCQQDELQRGLQGIPASQVNLNAEKCEMWLLRDAVLFVFSVL